MKSFQLLGDFASPKHLTRGSAPGHRWGHSPRPPTSPTFAIPPKPIWCLVSG